MSSMTTTTSIKVPVTLQMEIKNAAQTMRKVHDELQNALSGVDPSSTIGKNLTRVLEKVSSKINDLDYFAGKEIFSEKDLSTSLRLIEQISKYQHDINSTAQAMSARQLGLETEELKEAEKAVAALYQKITELKNLSVAQALQDLGNTDDLKEFIKLSEQFNFDPSKNFKKNIDSMRTALAEASSDLIELQVNASDAGDSLQSAINKLSEIKASKNIITEADNARLAANQDLLQQFQAVKGVGSTKEGSRTNQNALNDYLKIIDSFIDDTGNFTDKGQQQASILGNWLKISETELNGKAQEIVDKLKAAITKAATKDNGKLSVSPIRNLIQTEAEGISEITQAEAVVATNEQAVATANKKLEEAKELQKQLQEYITKLQKLQEEYEQTIDANNRQELQAAVTARDTAATNATRDTKATISSGANESERTSSTVRIDSEAEISRQRAEIETQQEKQRFQDNLKASIEHWFSAQQIITTIKNGIRQAWQDIQGLDKAMTNIAVVTDMSVSDLWGKIDEYMSIAQEYGVTTQGVYEVSQLYYQQGLSANEVTAATTETLKLARIAGMEYKDAADAMTVAIRAFKMEMEDAATVTDVYSKVAAVTASDSEELAIAMSKTASSAESVGSSFENTTAMLAVMIETTRESAQNLGSALKSIISRYGEMKSGLTTDSEGEEIDYNKVDTALKSVGISIKDAQGQFRDFDDVIFELSKKWDSLDKNTQRYIATIMAGNRQQSRFIALVDNWDRLEQVSAAAADAEDAGLLQYAKTLDSLETKLNALSTSFQQFYMNIVNGDTFKGIIDFITNILNGLNKFGSWEAILNIALLIRSIKTVSSILIDGLSSPANKIYNTWTEAFKRLTANAAVEGQKAGQSYADNFNANSVKITRRGQNRELQEQNARNLEALDNLENQNKQQGKYRTISAITSLAGAALSTFGASYANENRKLGSVMNLGGNVLQGVGAGAAFGAPGMLIGGLIGGIASLPAILNAWDPATILQDKLDKANETLKEAQLKRAEKREEARNLESTIENLKKLQAARHSSEEAEKEFIEASNAAAEQFPQLSASVDASGNIIVDVINNAKEAEELLAQARRDAAKAATEAAAAEMQSAYIEEEQAQQEYNKYYGEFDFNTFSTLAGSTIGQELSLSWNDFKNLNMMEAVKKLENLAQDDLLSSIYNTLGFYDITDSKLLQQKATQARLALEQSQRRSAATEKAFEAIFTDEVITQIETTQEGYTNKWKELPLVYEQVVSSANEAVTGLTDNAYVVVDGVKQLSDEGKKKIEESVSRSIEEWQELINSKDFTTYKYNTLNSLLTSAKQNKITYKELDTGLKAIFGEILPEAVQKVLADFQTDTTESINNTVADLTRYDWANSIESLDLNAIPVDYLDELSTYASKLQSQIENSLINDNQAANALEQVISLYTSLDELNLASEKLGQARAAIAGTDFTSLSSVSELKVTLNELGIDADKLLGNVKVAAINYVTEFNSLNEKLAASMKSATDEFSKLGSGLSIEEAVKEANKLGLSLDEDFDFINGKFYIKDLTKARENIEDSFAQRQTDLAEALQITNDILSDKTVDEDQYQTILNTNGANAFEWAKTSTDSEIQALINNASSFEEVGDNQAKLIKKYLEYLSSIYGDINTEYLQYIQDEAERTANLTKYSNMLMPVSLQRKQQALDLIREKGTFGYTQDEISQIIQDLGLSSLDVSRYYDGSFGISWDLDNLTEDIKTALSDNLQNRIQSIIDNSKNIGNDIASKGIGKINYSDLFSTYKTKAENARKGIDEINKEITSAILEAISSDTPDDTALRQIIADNYNLDVNSSAVTEITKNIVEGYKATTNDSIVKILDLYLKQTEGTLTLAEQQTLDELIQIANDNGGYARNLVSQLQELDVNLADSAEVLVFKYLKVIETSINSLSEGINFDSIKDTVVSAYKSSFEKLQIQQQGYNAATVDSSTLDVIKQVEESAGKYSNDTLANMFAILGKETEKAFDPILLTSYFNWDSINNAWVLASDDIETALTDIYGEEIPKYILDAIKQSQNQYDYDNILRIDEAKNSIVTQIGGIYTDAAEITIKDLSELYDTIYGTGSFVKNADIRSYQEAIDDAREGELTALQDILKELIKAAQQSNIDIDTEKLTALIADAQNEIIKKILSNVEAAIDGSLSAEGLNDLNKRLNIDIKQYATSTFDGYKISSQGMMQIGSAMLDQYGETYEVAEKMYDLFVGDEGMYHSYQDLIKTAEELEDVEGNVSDEYKNQHKLLKQMASISLSREDDAVFDFMGQDVTRGLTKTADKMLESIDDVKSVFENFKKDEIINYSDFYNMMDFMYKQHGSDWNSLSNALGLSDAALAKLQTSAGIAINTYDDFVNAIVISSKEMGAVKVDQLLNIGISMEDMSKGMSESLKKVAQQQIDYLQSLKKTLLALQQLEDIKFEIFQIETDDGTYEVTIDNFLDHISELGDKIDPMLASWRATLTKKFGSTFVENIFGTDTDYNEAELKAIERFGKFYKKFEDLDFTPEEYLSLAKKILAYGEDVFDEVSGSIDFTKLFTFLMDHQELDLLVDEFSYEATQKLAEAISTQGDIPIEFNANGTFSIVDGKDPAEAKEFIEQQLQQLGYGDRAIVTTIDDGTLDVVYVDPIVKATIEQLENTQGTELHIDSLTGVSTITATVDGAEIQLQLDKNGNITWDNDQNQEAIDKFLSNNNLSITKSADGSSAHLNITVSNDTVTNTATIEENVATITSLLSDGITIKVDDQASGVLSTIQQAYISLVDTIAARPIEIKAQGNTIGGVISSSPSETKTKEQASNELVPLSQKISISWEGLDDWKQDKLNQNVKLNFTNLDGWKRPTLTQEVKIKYVTSQIPGQGSGDVDVVSGAYDAKGNVNIGAALARGTLMGELGPELYVQDGAYHIAGANGPEFVDLKDDAIVFNHLQTANLLGKGHTTKTGSPIVSERRSVSAYATGNVDGPAHASSNISNAIQAIDRAIAVWQNILNASLPDLLDSGKGNSGGSGNTLKAVTEELEEWYNLTRQIEDIQQNINNLVAELVNIPTPDGEAYLKNLREQQKLLNQQIATQKALLDYQELQLERQANFINQNKIWSQFLTIDENGLLQYIVGNETNGGKGALQVLQELNEMSGADQVAYLKKLGYSYTTNDGEVLEGSDLVEQFFQELQDQIDQYDALYDTVNGTKETIEKLRSDIEDINEEIKQNQMDLEEAVYDVIVSAWEKEIEQMEKQAEIIKEANEAYVDSLTEAISAEKELYSQNQSISDREQLQRQLSLLRRSGGSASEIASLETQLDSMLQDEYFSNQEKMVDSIREANEKQVQQLEEQIKIQQESLEYQKENGVIWTQVYEVLSQSKDAILSFLQGNTTDFFSKSYLQQEQMLTEWAHKIGIYTEDKKYQSYAQHALNNIWNNEAVWNEGGLANYQSTYNNLSEDDKNTIRDQFISAYAQARLDGKDHDTALQEATSAIEQTLKRKQDAINSAANQPPTTTTNPPTSGSSSGSSSDSSSGSSGGGSYSTITMTCTAGNAGGTPTLSNYHPKAKETVTVTPNAKSGYAFDYLTYNGNKKTEKTITPSGNVASIAIVVYYKQTSSSSSNSSSNSNTNNWDASGNEVANGTGTGWHFHINKNGQAVFKSAAYATRDQATAAALVKLKEYPGHKYSTKYYSKGGLVDYTGLAMVHGSKTEPESFLNAEQTQQVREGLEISGKGATLDSIKDTLNKLNATIKSVSNISNKTETNTYTISPGAVVIQVEQLNDAYDVDTLSADIMNRMYAIGNKATNRGVSRR